MENDRMPTWAEVADATFAGRSQRLVESVTKSNALRDRLIEWQKTLPPPTLAQRLRDRISRTRRWLGSKIAGADLDGWD